MDQLNSITEILEFAIAREADANRLYTYLAEQTQDPQMHQAFLDFAKEELEHKQRLELEMLKEGITVWPNKDISTLTPQDYIEQFNIDPDMDYMSALLFAIKKERASFRLYVELAVMAPDEQWRNMLLELAEEEAMHKTRFEIEYNFLKLQKEHPTE